MIENQMLDTPEYNEYLELRKLGLETLDSYGEPKGFEPVEMSEVAMMLSLTAIAISDRLKHGPFENNELPKYFIRTVKSIAQSCGVKYPEVFHPSILSEMLDSIPHDFWEKEPENESDAKRFLETSTRMANIIGLIVVSEFLTNPAPVDANALAGVNNLLKQYNLLFIEIIEQLEQLD